MIKSYGDTNWRQLQRVYPDQPGVLPRVSRYGEDSAWELGIKPIEAQDMVQLLQWEDLKEALNKSHEEKTQPIYHQYNTWCPTGNRWNQDGIPYCWAWSATATMMDLRAMESKETIMLSPVSLGWLVGWKSQGYYLDSTINGLRERGVAPASATGGDPDSTNRNPNSYEDDWAEQALQYRLDEVWDIDTRSGDKTSILQAATALCSGRPIYLAYNWWSHALMCTGMRWDESKKNNVLWQIRNSHNEDDVIEMDGDRGVADEMYAFVSSVLA